LGKVPVLELDDGTLLTESVAICRYLEALHPEKPLFGHTNLKKDLDRSFDMYWWDVRLSNI
jgi:glutathione S-transferase